jgi:hypothetical protein
MPSDTTMQDHTSPPPSPLEVPSSGRPTLTDAVFLLSMVVMLALVAWVGQLSYHEGMKTEVSKHNGELWAQWLSETSAARFKEDYGLLACAGGPTRAPAESADSADAGEAATPAIPTVASTPAPQRNWGECLKYLTTPPGSLAGLRNPFFNEPINIVPKCDPSDRSLVGALVLEKLVPTPPGSTIPFVTSPLVESDPIEAKLQIRVTVCDKGAYPIRVAEVEF